jgi:hypothetical protein
MRIQTKNERGESGAKNLKVEFLGCKSEHIPNISLWAALIILNGNDYRFCFLNGMKTEQK